jgi:hypothetical protein
MIRNSDLPRGPRIRRNLSNDRSDGLFDHRGPHDSSPLRRVRRPAQFVRGIAVDITPGRIIAQQARERKPVVMGPFCALRIIRTGDH